MRAIWAVYKRELALYFRSAIAYGIAFGLMFFLGLLFSANVSTATQINLSAASGGFGASQIIPADVLVTSTMGTLTLLMFIFAPLLTMRLIAEEAREGTLEVLMTLPMNESAFIIGKFLAAWTYYTFVLALTFLYVVLLAGISPVDSGRVLAAYFGAWLYGGATIAVALIWSAVTEDQILAAFLGAATILVFFLAELAAIWAEGQGFSGLVGLTRELSLQAHYQDTMLAGIIRAEDIVYFILLMIGSLFITTRIVETRRWRA